MLSLPTPMVHAVGQPSWLPQGAASAAARAALKRDGRITTKPVGLFSAGCHRQSIRTRLEKGQSLPFQFKQNYFPDINRYIFFL